MKKINRFSFLAAFFGITLISCCGSKEKEKEEEKDVAVTGVTLNKSIVNLLDIEEAFQLEATVLPENATNQNVHWHSDNEDVATVDGTGQVTVRGYGIAVITVTTDEGNFTATCEVTVTEPEEVVNPFIRTNGSKFIDGDGKEIVFRGIGFGFPSDPYPANPPDIFGEQDYRQMSEIGFNNVRFYIGSKWFENSTVPPYTYKQTGWNWLDRHIAWAKKYNMTLVLCMAIQPGSTGEADRHLLFTNKAFQDRHVALWRAIADHCKNEPAIAGYELLNEPFVKLVGGEGPPFTLTFASFQAVTQRTVDAIREVDMNHTIIVEHMWLTGASEPAIGTYNANPNDQRDTWKNVNGKYNFPDIDDPANNYAYAYHCYEPGRFTHQAIYAPTDGSFNYDHVYPNPADVAKWGDIDRNGAECIMQESLSSSETDYVTLTHTFRCEQTTIQNTGRIDLMFVNVPVGATVWCRKVLVKELDENKQFIRDVIIHDFTRLYHFSSYAGNPPAGMVFDKSEKLIQVNGPFNNFIRSNGAQFLMTKGRYYELTMEVKGENIGEAKVYPRFFINERPQAWGYTKEFLEYIYTLPANYIRNVVGVPIYLSELGIHQDNFIDNWYGVNRGGAQWIEDVYDILLNKHKISNSFHPYFIYEINPNLYQPLANAWRKAFIF